MVDFEKAFNRQNHHKLITKLSDMGLGFLEERTIVVSYKGEKSGVKAMPGGGPQGTILGMFLFLVLINDVGFKKESESIGIKLTKAFNKRKELDTKHWKYVDDLTVAEALKLKESLENDDDDLLKKPLTYHNWNNQILPLEASQVQKQLEEINEYAVTYETKVNHKKSKVMLFNTSRKYDFTQALTINKNKLEVVEELKLIGVQITNDLKLNQNTKNLTTKAYSRLWMLRRLKSLGAKTQN